MTFLLKRRPLNASFRLTCRLPHCRFDDDISSTAQASLAAEGWPSGKQRQANRLITLPLCPPRQIADSWILFNLGAIAARWKAKAALPLRAATLKQQAMITRRSGKVASGKLVWNQHNRSLLEHLNSTLNHSDRLNNSVCSFWSSKHCDFQGVNTICSVWTFPHHWPSHW